MKRTEAILGDHNVTCDYSGKVYKRSEMRWTVGTGTNPSYLVHWSKWDEYNPQVQIKTRREQISVKDVRVQGPDFFPTPPTPSEL